MPGTAQLAHHDRKRSSGLAGGVGRMMRSWLAERQLESTCAGRQVERTAQAYLCKLGRAPGAGVVPDAQAEALRC